MSLINPDQTPLARGEHQTVQIKSTNPQTGEDFVVHEIEADATPETDKILEEHATSHATTPDSVFMEFMSDMEVERDYWKKRCKLAEDYITNK